MRRIVTAITAAALALSLVAQSTPAEALVAGYDSSYAGESAFLTLRPGEQGSFTVFFANTGATTWTRGTSTQVDLYACLNNKTTCDVAPEESAWNPGSWLSSTRYATQVQTTVAPGAIATYTYNITVPASAATGDYDFNGDTGVSSLSGAAGQVHPEGYFQRVTVPATAAAAITVTPTDTQVLQVSDDTTTNRGARSYTATITGITGCVDLGLTTGSNTSAGRFLDTESTSTTSDDDRLADGLPGTTAVIEVVNGVALATPANFVDCVSIPTNGIVTFTVDSKIAGQTPKPVVWLDSDNDNRLDLTGDNDASGMKAALETNGVGGQTTYIAAARSSQANAEIGCVVNLDKTAKRFSIDVGQQGAGGPSEDANSLATNCSSVSSSLADWTFFYDANDEFFVRGVPVTMADFEAALSRSDIVDIDAYASSAEPQSRFNIQGDGPVALSCNADNVGGATPNNIKITATPAFPTSTTSNAVTWRIERAPMTGTATDEGSDGTVGTFSTVVTGPADEDANTLPALEWTDVNVPAGTYRYKCIPIIDADEGTRASTTSAPGGPTGTDQAAISTNEVSSAPGAAAQAPTSLDIRMVTNAGLVGQLDTNDVFRIVFNESMSATSANDVLRIQDADGTAATVSCATGSATPPAAGNYNAICDYRNGDATLYPTSTTGMVNQVVVVTITSFTAPSLAGEVGTVSGMQIPATVIDQGGFQDTTGDQWNVTGSSDRVIDNE